MLVGEVGLNVSVTTRVISRSMSSGRGQDGKRSDYTRCPENIRLLYKKKNNSSTDSSI